MATYTIKENEEFPWVTDIEINSDYDIDISSDYFNITVKDELEYFIMDYLGTGDTFELEELLKEDTEPTLVISKNTIYHKQMLCFRCGGSGEMTCPECNGTGLTDIGVSCSACGGDGHVECVDCGGDGIAKTVCDNEHILTDEFTNNIFQYNNSDLDSLVKNGIQFWIDNISKRTLYIRIVTKGKSTSNPAGYNLFNPITKEYYDSGYVGFTVADFNITLNQQEKLLFKCFNVPKLIMDDPVRLNDLDVSAIEKPHVVPSGETRVDFNWNDDANGDNYLYVNNTYPDTYTSASIYDQYPTDINEIFWDTSGTFIKGPLTPQYVVKSSAYINDFLHDESTYDLLTGEISSRNFITTSAMMKSSLYNEFSQKEIVLSSYFGEETCIPMTYIESNNQCISGNMWCNEIIQYLTDDTSGSKMVQNQVKLSLEI
jgi:hypothetical protein